MSEERKKLLIIGGLAVAVLIVAGVVFFGIIRRKPSVSTSPLPGAPGAVAQLPGAPGGTPMAPGPPGTVGAPAAAGAPGAAAAPAPTAPEKQPAPPAADQGYPIEPYRAGLNNPFVPMERESPLSDLLARLSVRDPGAIFSERAFPQPYGVWGPAPLEGVPQEIQPAAYFTPAPETPMGQFPGAPGAAIGLGPGGIPRVTAPAQPVGELGPQVEAKPFGARLRRLSGVLHDNAAFAILEAFDGSRVRTFIVQPGDRVQIGKRTFTVRAITGDQMILREEGRDFDTVIRLRGRTANEPGG